MCTANCTLHIAQLYYQTKKIYIFVNKTIFTCSYIIRQKILIFVIKNIFTFRYIISDKKDIYLCQLKHFYPSLFLKIAQLLQLQYLESVFHVGLKD